MRGQRRQGLAWVAGGKKKEKETARGLHFQEMRGGVGGEAFRLISAAEKELDELAVPTYEHWKYCRASYLT